jgi:hypothetical protein
MIGNCHHLFLRTPAENLVRGFAIEQFVVLWLCYHLRCFSCRHSRYYFRESHPVSRLKAFVPGGNLLARRACQNSFIFLIEGQELIL